MNFVKLEKKDHIAILGLDRPSALNALNEEMLDAIHTVVQNLSSDKQIHGVLFYGMGDRAFVAGADIATMKEASPETNAKFCQKGKDVFSAINQANLISVAAVSGFAFGGGLELALACDMRLASHNALFALPEVSLGIYPGFGGTQRLPRLIGPGLALELILSGSQITAKRAHEIGLVNHVYFDEEHDQIGESFLEFSENFLRKLLGKNSVSAQLAARRVIHEGLDLSLAEGLQKEQKGIEKLFLASDAKEGFSAFLEKRSASFS